MRLTTSRVILCLIALGSCGPLGNPAPTPAPGSGASPGAEGGSGPATEWETPPSPATSQNGTPARAAEPSTTAPATKPATPGLAPKFQRILDQHNRHRAAHCAPEMTWSPEIAKASQAWADKLKASGCAFEHSGDRRFGENLSYFMPEGMLSPEQVATGWYDEVTQYDFNAGRFGFNTGHFTQLVWVGSTRLGCGVSICNGGELWVCNYDPPGNVQGAFRQNVKPTSCR